MRAFQGREAEKYGSIYQRPGQQEKRCEKRGSVGVGGGVRAAKDI